MCDIMFRLCGGIMISKTIHEIEQMLNVKAVYNKMQSTTQIRGVCIDSRLYSKSSIYFAIQGERVDGHTFIDSLDDKGCPLCILSDVTYAPKNAAYILVDDVISTLQLLAREYRLTLECDVIGITGSNGKTSVKDMLFAVLGTSFNVYCTKGNQNNEIGVPLTILALPQDVQVAIVEMGLEKEGDLIFLQDIVRHNIAILTNVGRAHLTHFHDIEHLAKSKLEITHGLQNGDVFYVHEDPLILSQLDEHPAYDIVTFGEKDSNAIFLKQVTQLENGIYIQLQNSDTTFFIPILGIHQAINALSVIAIAKKMGLNEEQIQDGFNNLKNTSMRNEMVRMSDMVILNDAYKSNPESAKAALDTFACFEAPYKIAVLADMLDLGEDEILLHKHLGEYVQGIKVDELLCVGDLGKYIIEGYEGSAIKIHFENIEDISKYLSEYMHKDCMVLLKGSRGMQLEKIIQYVEEYNHE